MATAEQKFEEKKAAAEAVKAEKEAVKAEKEAEKAEKEAVKPKGKRKKKAAAETDAGDALEMFYTKRALMAIGAVTEELGIDTPEAGVMAGMLVRVKKVLSFTETGK